MWRVPALVALVLALGSFVASAPSAQEPQPIAFSHKTHAGTNEIGCTMCHAYAERSTIAGIPSMARCMGCHKFVAKDKPGVQQLSESFEKEQGIQWNRIYRVPDHVYFSHERHLAAQVRCQECHGDVRNMDVVTQVSSLTMGWCVDCHRSRHAPLDCLTCHK